MRRQIKLVLTIFGIVLTLGAAMIILDLTEPVYEENSVVFRDSPPTDVQSVRIANEYGEFLVEYLETDGGYAAGDLPIDLVDMDRFVEMMKHSGAVYAANTVRDPKDWAAYGLEGDIPSVEIEYQDGQSIRIYIGSHEPISDNYYCRVEGKDDVYLFEAKRIHAYLQPQKYFISHYVTPPIPAQSQSSLGHVLSIEFEGGSFAQSVRLNAVTADDKQLLLDAMSFGAATHLMNIYGRNYRVDQKYATEVFDSLVGLLATDIVAYNVSNQEMDAFGFDEPDMQVRFDFRQTPEAVPLPFSLSLLNKNGEFYASCNDRGVIYKIAQPYFYTATYENLPVRWFFSPLLFDLDQLAIRHGDDVYTFDISGSTIAELAVKCNGESFDLERFRSLYKLITSAAHDNTMQQPAEIMDEAILSITYRYRQTEKEPDVLNLYPAAARRHLAEANGIAAFTIKEQFYTRVVQALEVLFTDEPFEVTW